MGAVEQLSARALPSWSNRDKVRLDCGWPSSTRASVQAPIDERLRVLKRPRRATPVITSTFENS
jgi:hypothetical protein